MKTINVQIDLKDVIGEIDTDDLKNEFYSRQREIILRAENFAGRKPRIAFCKEQIYPTQKLPKKNLK